jgi:hypothetical protein
MYDAEDLFHFIKKLKRLLYFYVVLLAFNNQV